MVEAPIFNMFCHILQLEIFPYSNQTSLKSPPSKMFCNLQCDCTKQLKPGLWQFRKESHNINQTMSKESHHFRAKNGWFLKQPKRYINVSRITNVYQTAFKYNDQQLEIISTIQGHLNTISFWNCVKPCESQQISWQVGWTLEYHGLPKPTCWCRGFYYGK